MTEWLIDKSALTRLNASSGVEEWLNLITRGLVRVSAVTRLEVGYSARNVDDHRALLERPPLAAMPVEHLTPAIEDRALEVQRELASVGQHRAPSLPDLLIAATAELTRLVVLHVDKDFDLIATITGQPTQRLTPADPNSAGFA